MFTFYLQEPHSISGTYSTQLKMTSRYYMYNNIQGILFEIVKTVVSFPVCSDDIPNLVLIAVAIQNLVWEKRSFHSQYIEGRVLENRLKLHYHPHYHIHYFTNPNPSQIRCTEVQGAGSTDFMYRKQVPKNLGSHKNCNRSIVE